MVTAGKKDFSLSHWPRNIYKVYSQEGLGVGWFRKRPIKIDHEVPRRRMNVKTSDQVKFIKAAHRHNIMYDGHCSH